MMNLLKLESVKIERLTVYIIMAITLVVPGTKLVSIYARELYSNLDIMRLLILAAFYTTPVIVLNVVMCVIRHYSLISDMKILVSKTNDEINSVVLDVDESSAYINMRDEWKKEFEKNHGQINLSEVLVEACFLSLFCFYFVFLLKYIVWNTMQLKGFVAVVIIEIIIVGIFSLGGSHFKKLFAAELKK